MQGRSASPANQRPGPSVACAAVRPSGTVRYLLGSLASSPSQATARVPDVTIANASQGSKDTLGVP